MGGQHDEDASPGYMGPEGVPDTASADDEADDRGVLAKLKDAASRGFGDDARQAEEQPGAVGEGMGVHERQDVGLETADVAGVFAQVKVDQDARQIVDHLDG